MGFIGKIVGAALVAGAALAGNIVGNSVRSMTGNVAPRNGFLRTTANVQGLPFDIYLSNFLPALLLAILAGKPRIVYAFVSGAVISALLGDAYEQKIVATLRG